MTMILRSSNVILLLLLSTTVANACNEETCNLGLAAGNAASCGGAVVAGTVGAVTCGATFGIGCAVGFGVGAALGFACAGTSAASSKKRFKKKVGNFS